MIWSSIDPGVAYFAEATWSGTDLAAVGVYPLDEVPQLLLELAVIEKPQVYRHARARNADIVDLAMSAARLAARFEHVVWYLPREWKGQVPKAIHHERIKEALTGPERLLVSGWNKSEREHIWDAIGLGLYHMQKEGKR